MAHATQSMGPSDAARERRWGRIQAASGLVFAASALYHGLNGTWLALHALGLRADASLPGGCPALFTPVVAGSLLLVLALLAFGGRLFPIPDPRDNDYARMWERYGVDLGTR